MNYSIKEVADFSKITIRALHYDDKIELLVPLKREGDNYRVYEDEDLEKLQQILLFKEMGFPLKKIKALSNYPDYDRKKALAAQLVFLENQAERYLDLADLVKDTLESLGGEKKMKKENLFKGFDYEARLKEQGKYEEETKRRWGILMPIKNLREEPQNILKRTGLKSCLLKMTT